METKKVGKKFMKEQRIYQLENFHKETLIILRSVRVKTKRRKKRMRKKKRIEKTKREKYKRKKKEKIAKIHYN